MILVLGVGIVGKAVLNYFKSKGKCSENEDGEICFFDDCVKIIPGATFFDWLDVDAWNKIKLVVASPGFALNHDIIQEAIRRQISITNDIGIFLNQHRKGINIGITGTNGKSTTCAILKHVLGDRASVGGNFGISPLDFDESEFYILELSSYQLELLEKNELGNLTIGAITNIYPNHLARHGSMNDYISAKCRIFSAKHKFLGHCELFNTWEFPKAKLPEKLPNSPLFEKEEYKYCWGMIEMILQQLGIDIEEARLKAASYECLPFRQQVITTAPITIINDSKSSNSIAAQQALSNIDECLCWIAGGAGNSDWSNFCAYKKQESQAPKSKIKKVFICGESQKELVDLCKEFGMEYEIYDELESATKAAIQFAINSKLVLLFSPGYQSFDQFKNFEHRGAQFNEYVKKYTAAN